MDQQRFKKMESNDSSTVLSSSASAVDETSRPKKTNLCADEITIEMIENFLNPVGKRTRKVNYNFEIPTATGGFGIRVPTLDTNAPRHLRRNSSSIKPIQSTIKCKDNNDDESSMIDEFGYLEMRNKYERELLFDGGAKDLNENYYVFYI